MSTTWENIVNHAGTIYGHDISNELQSKKRFEILQPEHINQAEDKHLKIVEQLRDKQSRPMKYI